jgi:hypothetical protein
MVVRIARILSISTLLILLTVVQPAKCEGWSLLHPFSSDTTTDTKPKRPVYKTAKQEPSTWNKVTTGTKSFFSKTGEKLGLKKPEAKKPQYATPRMPPVAAQKKNESKSWLGSMFKPEEPAKPKTVSDWMANPRVE